MSNITKIDEILKTRSIKSSFQGFIADVEFSNQHIYDVVTIVLYKLKDKFTRINRPKEFVNLLKNSINDARLNFDLNTTYDMEINDKYELNDLKNISITGICFILCQAIKRANKFEDIEFKVTSDDDSFDELNKLIKEKRFNYTSLSDEEIKIVEKDNLFHVNEVQEWLNNDVKNQNRAEVLKFYYELIQRQIKQNISTLI